LSCGALVALFSTALVHRVVDTELRQLASRGIFVHYGVVFYAGPAIAAASLFVASRWSIPAAAHGAGRARFAFWTTAFVLTAVNLANWCSPGWCERFGFPVPYRWWSDAIIVMNGVNLSAGESSLAVIVDAVAVGAAALLASRLASRSATGSV
jgi:hypothetical protein